MRKVCRMHRITISIEMHRDGWSAKANISSWRDLRRPTMANFYDKNATCRVASSNSIGENASAFSIVFHDYNPVTHNANKFRSFSFLFLVFFFPSFSFLYFSFFLSSFLYPFLSFSIVEDFIFAESTIHPENSSNLDGSIAEESKMAKGWTIDSAATIWSITDSDRNHVASILTDHWLNTNRHPYGDTEASDNSQLLSYSIGSIAFH